MDRGVLIKAGEGIRRAAVRGSWERWRRGGIQGQSGRQMEEGSFIVSSLRIDSLSRQGTRGRWANQTIMAPINRFLDCALALKPGVSG